MISKRPFGLVSAVVAVAFVLAVGELQAAELAQAPALSTLARVEDLVAQVEYYVEELGECVEDLGEYGNLI